MLQQEQGAPAGTAQGIPGLGQGKGGGAEAPAQPGLRRPDGPGVEQMAGGELQQDAPLLQAAAGPPRLPDPPGKAGLHPRPGGWLQAVPQIEGLQLPLRLRRRGGGR